MKRVQKPIEIELLKYFQSLGFKAFAIASDPEAIWMCNENQKFQWLRFSDEPINNEQLVIVLEKLKQHPKYKPNHAPILNIVSDDSIILPDSEQNVVFSYLKDQYETYLQVKKKRDSAVSNQYILISMIMFISVISGMVLAGSFPIINMSNLSLNYKSIVEDLELWRLITYTFVHGDLIHLIMNMLSLWILGKFIMELYIRKWTLLAYLIGGIFSGLFVVSLQHNVALIGASGALYTWFGLIFYFTIKNRKQLPNQFVNSIFFVIAINVLISLTPGVSALGHLSGFVMGVLIAPAISILPDENKRNYLMALSVLMTFVIFTFVINIFGV